MEMVHFIPPSQRRLAILASQADSAPVLLHGQAGTGKSSLGQWIHSQGPRATLPFIIAHQKQSLSEQIALAQAGTFFIPEISDWPLGEQRILLDFLRTKTIRHPKQDNTPMILNTRIMCSTSHNLEGRAQGGLFNSELLQKLNVFRIEMPELSKRTHEFEDIVVGILGEITRELQRDHIQGLSEQSWAKLQSYEWPGNLRELRNVLRVSVIKSQGDVIETHDLPEFGINHRDFRAKRDQFEKTYITELLKTYHWQLDRTCQESHLDREVLLKKIKKYGIDLVTNQSNS